jgi:hypothetical protein
MAKQTNSAGSANLCALLIGVDFYFPNSLPGGGSYTSLGGCVRDVSHVEAFLKRTLGVPEERILKLTASNTGTEKPPEPREQWPTYENMVAKFKNLAARAQPGDQVYIHYSGHGGRTSTAYPDLKGAGTLDEALVPTDIGNSTSRYLRDVELAYLLKDMVDRGLLVTVVLDSCHSGGATRGIGKATPRGIADIDTGPRRTDSLVASPEELAAAWLRQTGGATRAAKPASGWMVAPQGYTFLAACRANEYAYEDFFDSKEKNGALTYWLLNSLRTMSPNTSYKMLHDRILAKIRSWMEAQTPQLQGEGDRAVFGAEHIKPYFAIPVMKVDETRNRVALNAGEAHGLRTGTLLAIYPQGTSTAGFASTKGRQALVQVVELVEDADCWAEITERYGTDAIEQGAQAVLLGNVDMRMQRTVGIVLEDETLREGMEAAIVTHGTGFIRPAMQDEPVDFQVAIVKPGDDGHRIYEIWDRKGTTIPNLRPAIRSTDPRAAEKIAKRLVHLAKYRNVQALDNPDPTMAQKLRVELIGAPTDDESGHTPIFRPGEVATLKVHNTLQPNPNDLNDPTRILNVTILDLQPDWGITQIFPARAGSSHLLQPGKSVELKFGAQLPEGYSENTDILKVFATQKTTNFRWLELPVLDQPPEPMPATLRAIDDPLELLIAAFTDEQAPSEKEIKTRAIKLISISSQDRPWAAAQVELCVKKAD